MMGRVEWGNATGGVFYTVGGAAAPSTLRFAPPTLCFGTPTLGRFGGLLALKRWFLTLTMQNTFVDISTLSFLF